MLLNRFKCDSRFNYLTFSTACRSCDVVATLTDRQRMKLFLRMGRAWWAWREYSEHGKRMPRAKTLKALQALSDAVNDEIAFHVRVSRGEPAESWALSIMRGMAVADLKDLPWREVDSGIVDFMRRRMEQSFHFKKFIDQAIALQKRVSATLPKGHGSGDTTTRWLRDDQMPRLYTQVVGKKFTATINPISGKPGPGARFAIWAEKLITGIEPNAETLVADMKAAKRRGRDKVGG
jgi:hypothetical protein